MYRVAVASCEGHPSHALTAPSLPLLISSWVAAQVCFTCLDPKTHSNPLLKVSKGTTVGSSTLLFGLREKKRGNHSMASFCL